VDSDPAEAARDPAPATVAGGPALRVVLDQDPVPAAEDLAREADRGFQDLELPRLQVHDLVSSPLRPTRPCR